MQLVRSLGLHKPDETPCGQPVSIGEAHALLEIAREPGMTQNGLAARLRLEKSTVSRLAGLLERRGWIRRLRDERDARCVRLHLTRRGMSANANIAESRRAKFDRLFGAIPAARREAVVESLALLLEVARED
ncbi:MAG: transcriptional regulator, MarR family [Candidatus Eremiobacteraeota bacterium]|nr:transcriptional regulator, MarR family [Candidatus Eremiobacteraeota bacterium]